MWLTSLVPIGGRQQSLTTVCPVANRVSRDGEPNPPLSDEQMAASLLQDFGIFNVMSDFQFLLHVYINHERLGFTVDEVQEMCTIVSSRMAHLRQMGVGRGVTHSHTRYRHHQVATKDTEGAATYKAKIDSAFGLGYVCPVCEADGVRGGGYYTNRTELYEHVSRAHSSASTKVVRGELLCVCMYVWSLFVGN